MDVACPGACRSAATVRRTSVASSGAGNVSARSCSKQRTTSLVCRRGGLNLALRTGLASMACGLGLLQRGAGVVWSGVRDPQRNDAAPDEPQFVVLSRARGMRSRLARGLKDVVGVLRHCISTPRTPPPVKRPALCTSMLWRGSGQRMFDGRAYRLERIAWARRSASASLVAWPMTEMRRTSLPFHLAGRRKTP